jgi:arylamine N-acetyltransferase
MRKKTRIHSMAVSRIRHSYEPISQKTSDDGYQLIIDDETVWIPTCKINEKNLKENDIVKNELYQNSLEYMRRFHMHIKIIIAKINAGVEITLRDEALLRRLEKIEECQECVVMDLTSHLDLLDFMSADEVISNLEQNEQE